MGCRGAGGRRAAVSGRLGELESVKPDKKIERKKDLKTSVLLKLPYVIVSGACACLKA